MNENWKRLGNVTLTGTSLGIELDATASAEGLVIADGVLLREIVSGSEEVTTLYDGFGNMIRQSNALGEATRYEHDQLGRAIKSIDAQGSVTKQSFDLLGNAKEVLDPVNNLTTWIYNTFNEKIFEQQRRGSTSVPSRKFTYDKAGNTEIVVDRLGRAIRYTYDEQNFLEAESWYDSQHDAESETGAIDVIEYGYDDVGRIDSVSNIQGAYAFDYYYDARDRMIEVTRAIGSTNVKLGIDYGNRLDGLRDSLFVWMGAEIDTVTSYVYDEQLRVKSLSQVSGNSNARPKHVTFTYDAASRFDKITRFADTRYNPILWTRL